MHFLIVLGKREDTELESKLKEKDGYTKHTQTSKGIIALPINLLTRPPGLH